MSVLVVTENATNLRGHLVPTGLFIGGKWLASAKTIPVTNPSDGNVIAEISDGDPRDAILALDAAVLAAEDWRHWAPRRRADLFHKAHALLMERAQSFAEVMVLESGKPLAEAQGEFSLSSGYFLWYAEQIAHLHGTYQEG
ncbi:MAG: aldehyde dehydrogenase family protein, partial [Actinomycetales bacterium]|nr:aldehyde dehydrogenase family protein [Actinomycetales bacterium]